MDNIEIIKFLQGVQKDITDAVVEVLSPQIMQNTEAIRNSTVIQEQHILTSLKQLESRATPKFHLWVIYPLIATLFVGFAYIYATERGMVKLESGLETEVKTLIEQLQKQSVETSADELTVEL